MRVGMTMQIVYLWITFTFILQKRCSAKELLCTVKELDGLTIYTVPKDNATKCHFFLKHPNGTVLENHESVNEMEGQSEWTFPFKVCYNQLNFSCNCFPEGQHNKAICTTDCSKHGRKEKGVGDRLEMKNDPPKSANDNVTPRHHWTLIVPGIIFILVLLLLLLLAFCYKDHNSRLQVHF